MYGAKGPGAAKTPGKTPKKGDRDVPERLKVRNAKGGVPVALPGLGGAAAAAAAAAGLLLGGGPAAAELNRLEYERGGEFNRGTAMQFGGTDMIKVDIAKQYGNDLRLSNFVQGEWLRAARCIRRTGRRADATA